jgi:tetratricopeptide (TPR) repeat protein
MNVDDSLSKLVRNYLVLTKIGKEVNPDLKPYHTNSPEAFKYFIIAGNAWSRGDLNTSLQYYKKAADIDTSFTAAIVFASMRYADLGNYNDAKEWCIKAYNKREHLPEREKLLAEWYHAELFEGPEEEIKYLEQYVEYDDQVPVVYWHLGRLYNELFEYNLAIPEFEKALEIYSKWGIRPMAPFNYINLGYAYHKTGQYIKERSLYKKAEKDFPDNSDVSFMQAVLAFSEGDSISANKYIERYIFLEKQAGNDADTSIFLAGLYNEVGSLNKAEKNYRKALSLYPENPFWINAFAYFLIEKNRNINEGISLADKALKLSPDNWAYLDTKGYGLYKQGKYNEALELLEKSWKLKPIYNRDIYLHLQEVRKAIAY